MSEVTKIDDGGPAFPCKVPYQFGGGDMQGEEVFPGMSLRDYFAAAALGHVPKLMEVNGRNLTASGIAAWSYEMADAMLAARTATSNTNPA